MASSCASGGQDGDETGVNCGGGCELCRDGQGCRVPSDCLSGVGPARQFFVGSIDEIVRYIRALSATEISAYVRRTKHL